MEEHRPNPDKLLKRAQEEERLEKRGKLKIYLGAAPGVGKTHEMLHDALAERNKGLDVVIGVAESHGRSEIDEMLKGFDILPKQIIEYHGKQLKEFDLDGALKRSPGLILIDEMAHSNVPGLRHKKRWQDIKELLDRGINVYTTLNIQHVESLNDDVAQIIHAPVTEMVPDSMIEMADAIELVDIPTDDLIKRLHEGKVYFPEQAALASDLFFRKGNLSALRELALRMTAERVGAQILSYRQGQGIRHVWPAMEKILVCVGSSAESLKLIRAAKRLATSLKVNWIAVYVDTPSMNMSDEARSEALKNLRYAEQFGAETRVLTGYNITHEILEFAREQNVTQIMIFKNLRRRWKNFFMGTIADDIVKNSGEIDVYIMTGLTESAKPSRFLAFNKNTTWQDYGLALMIVGFLTLFNFILFPYVKSSNLVMVYLLGVALVSLRGRSGPSILASILSVFAYDVLFVPPVFNLKIANLEDMITVLVMLSVSQVISQLTILTRRQADNARLIERQTSALYMLSQQLASTRGVDKLLNAGISYIANFFESEVIALLPDNDGGELVIRARNRTSQILDAKEQGIAHWVFEMGQMAGAGTDTLSFSKALYLPLSGSQEVMGVLRVLPADSDLFISIDKMHLLEACVNQIALALEVDRLNERSQVGDLHTEVDRVRGALMQSVSHDLRKPLVAIIGAASTQMELAKTMDAHAIEKNARDIYDEAEQLSRLINNLLQITYFEANQVKLQKNLAPIEDVINLVIHTAGKKLAGRKVTVHVPDQPPPVPYDQTLIQEVLFNLIDNAVKFTVAGTDIDIYVNVNKDNLQVCVDDCGPGIVADEVNMLFEKYYRGRMLTTERGLGLGLAICRMVIEAHGGRMWVENKVRGGSSFCFTLPLH